MKKIIVAILAILYLGTSTGATLHMHYCMGELADWGLKHDDSKECGNCGSEKAGKNNIGFCKVEKKFVKNDTYHKNTNSAFKRFQLSAPAISVSFIDFFVVNFSSVTEKNPFSHAPPIYNGAAIYIRNCVFLI